MEIPSSSSQNAIHSPLKLVLLTFSNPPQSSKVQLGWQVCAWPLFQWQNLNLVTKVALQNCQGRVPQEKMEKKRRKIEKGKVKNWKWKGEKQNEERTVFSFFLFLCFLLFKTTKICFESTKNGNFLLGKSIARQEKNQENWLCSLWKIFFLDLCDLPYINTIGEWRQFGCK